MKPQELFLLGYSASKTEPASSAPDLTPADDAACISLMSELVKGISASDKTIILDEAWKLLGSVDSFKHQGTSFFKKPWERSRPKYLTVGGAGPELVELLEVLAESSIDSWLPSTEPGSASAVILEQSDSGILLSVTAPYSCAELSTHINQKFPALSVSVSLSPGL